MKILNNHVKAEHLIRHALTVEAVMRYFAKMYSEDVEKWGIIGLLHDIDFEKYPEQHCFKVREMLAPHGFPDEYIRAIESHGFGLVNDVEPVERMEKVLFATDELTGLIAATALMRPSRSILDLELSSVKKKWKQKGFAAGVNRDVVLQGAAMLGMELDELIEHTIKGMQTVAEEIGLKGAL
jgi:putative nucleotidyltransferase with HDIG domain